jgi:hypothetical protein
MQDLQQTAAPPAREAVATLPATTLPTTTLPAALKADCSRCAGLCCVVPAFYAVQGFGFDKPAHTACSHLGRDQRCTIHAELVSRGFTGCKAFDCFGAGQRVTQELLPGTSWRTSNDAAARVFAAYTCTYALHRLMAALVLMETTLPRHLADLMREERAQIDELCRSELCRTGRLDTLGLERRTKRLIREAYVEASSATRAKPR